MQTATGSPTYPSCISTGKGTTATPPYVANRERPLLPQLAKLLVRGGIPRGSAYALPARTPWDLLNATSRTAAKLMFHSLLLVFSLLYLWWVDAVDEGGMRCVIARTSHDGSSRERRDKTSRKWISEEAGSGGKPGPYTGSPAPATPAPSDHPTDDNSCQTSLGDNGKEKEDPWTAQVGPNLPEKRAGLGNTTSHRTTAGRGLRQRLKMNWMTWVFGSPRCSDFGLRGCDVERSLQLVRTPAFDVTEIFPHSMEPARGGRVEMLTC